MHKWRDHLWERMLNYPYGKVYSVICHMVAITGHEWNISYINICGVFFCDIWETNFNLFMYLEVDNRR